jgi:hypothetical protein
LPVIEVSVLDKNVVVLSILREETVDVTEFIVVSTLIDDSEVVEINIDVRSSFMVVVSNVDV